MATVKEKIYDEQIAPLLEKVIKICQDNKISMFSTYDLGYDEEQEQPMLCTTSLPISDEEDENILIERLRKVTMDGYGIVPPTRSFAISTTTLNSKDN